MADAELDRALLAVEQVAPPAVFAPLADELGRLRAMWWRAKSIPKDAPPEVRAVADYILGEAGS